VRGRLAMRDTRCARDAVRQLSRRGRPASPHPLSAQAACAPRPPSCWRRCTPLRALCTRMGKST
jgi:hypothetical protein